MAMKKAASKTGKTTAKRAPARAAKAAKPVATSADPSLANLNKVDHVVVLMRENRSFDHMLGYLSLEGGREDVDGLRAGMANDYGGRSYPIHHLDRTAFEPVEDPDHSGEATSVQIAGGAMSGFVDSFAAKLAQRGAADHDPG